jgi:hypothetical protein
LFINRYIKTIVMKKQILKYLLAFFVLIGTSQFSYAQTRVYVKVKPTATVVARPAAPHTGYVWVDDEWRPNGTTYERAEGHWVAPRAGYVWVPGHWANEARGYYWVPGHWKRV